MSNNTESSTVDVSWASVQIKSRASTVPVPLHKSFEDIQWPEESYNVSNNQQE